jgi:hypothetical protein
MELFISKYSSHLRGPGFGDKLSEAYDINPWVCAGKERLTKNVPISFVLN